MQSKVFLKFLNFKKLTTCFSPKFNFGENRVVGFFKLKKSKNTFDCITAGKPQMGPIFGVSSLTHLHCKSTKAFNFCILLHSYVKGHALAETASARMDFRYVPGHLGKF